MLKRVGVVFIAVGVVLMSSALLLFLYNAHEDESAGQMAEGVVADIQSYISEQEKMESSLQNEVETDREENESQISQEEAQLTIREIDGYEYIGYLSIPELDLELPVMADWDYKRLKVAPCRQFGMPETGDFVIAAHNYKSHFRYITKLAAGDLVYFTDMTGTEFTYSVVCLKTLKPEDVNKVQNSEYDLVLYTCTPGGASREAVFCRKYSPDTEKQNCDK